MYEVQVVKPDRPAIPLRKKAVVIIKVIVKRPDSWRDY
jgi:hypothetical protein